ncbi:MAG: DedA family protein [Chloroflexota bacterium]
MHISPETLQQFLQTWGYLAVALFVAIESTGVPFPGETMLIAAAVYAGTGKLSIPFVIASAAVGAIMGDNLGYLVGREGGRRLLLRFGKLVHLDERKLAVAERFFARHGDKTVFLGRFIAVLRAWAAFLAGVNRMPWPSFLFFNAAGGIVWAILYGILGFELGKNLPLLHRVLGGLGLAGLAVGVAAAIVVVFLYWRARKLEKQALGEETHR